MKINSPTSTNCLHRGRAKSDTTAIPLRSLRVRQEGTAVIVMLALLSLILVYISANAYSLRRLQQELKVTEQLQNRRLHSLSAAHHGAGLLPAPEPALPGTNGAPGSPPVHP